MMLSHGSNRRIPFIRIGGERHTIREAMEVFVEGAALLANGEVTFEESASALRFLRSSLSDDVVKPEYADLASLWLAYADHLAAVELAHPGEHVLACQHLDSRERRTVQRTLARFDD